MKPINGDKRRELGQALRAQYEAGATIEELATDIGRSYGLVRRLLIEANTELRGQGTRRPQPPTCAFDLDSAARDGAQP